MWITAASSTAYMYITASPPFSLFVYCRFRHSLRSVCLFIDHRLHLPFLILSLSVSSLWFAVLSTIAHALGLVAHMTAILSSVDINTCN